MTEIRPIQKHEAEDFLALLCRVFRLDQSRAQSVFFSEPFFDLNRKWALFKEGRMVSIVTTTPLIFGWGRAIGIAGVATEEADRRQGLSNQLLSAVLSRAEQDGEGPALLFAHQATLYEQLGFELLDHVIRAPITCDNSDEAEPLGGDQVESLYNAWAQGDPRRLIRDAQRWKYWNWMFRVCEPVGSGYICQEPGMIREVVGAGQLGAWPCTSGAEWVGLRSMAKQLDAPIGTETEELLLMGRGFGHIPQMFMTDQF